MKMLLSTIAVIILMGGCTYVTRNIGHVEHLGIEITRDAERVCSARSNGITGVTQTSCEYRVYTSEGVFSNKDDMFHWKFNSSDFQAEFREGRTCDITAVGFRIPFLSSYKNIIDTVCASPPDNTGRATRSSFKVPVQ